MSTDLATLTPDALTDFSEVEKIRLHRLLKERKEQKKRSGISFYRPHPKQLLFHTCGKRYRLVRVGNRWGKSLAGAAEDVSWLLGERPFISVGLAGRTVGIPQRPVKGLLICQDWEKAEEVFASSQGDGVTRGKLFQLLPEDRVGHVIKNHSGCTSKIAVKGLHGTSVLYIETVQSWKSNAMSAESSDWDFLHFDETAPEAMFKALSRGLVDRGGSVWFTCTLLNEPWISEFFVPSMREEVSDAEPFELGERWMITGSMRDNIFLDEKNIKEFEDSLSEDEKQCRINGIPAAFSGLIYKEFQPSKHIYRDIPHGWKAKNDPPYEYSIRFAVDPHPRTPTAVLFIATAPTGELFAYDEIFLSGTIDEIAMAIKLKLHGRNIIYGICDPLGFIESPIDGRSMCDVFLEHGIILEKGPKDPANGILQVKEVLKTEGLLHFSSDCRRTLWKLDRYSWDENQPDKPKPKDNHMCEDLYRLVLTGLDYIEPDDNDGQIIPYSSLETARFSIPGDKPKAKKWDPSVRYK